MTLISVTSDSINAHLRATGRKQPHYFPWGTNDTLTSFSNYETLPVWFSSRQVLIYLGTRGCTSPDEHCPGAYTCSRSCDTAAHGSVVPRWTWMNQFLYHAHYRNSCDVYKMVSSSSSVSRILCRVKNCSSCHQRIYHECKAKHTLGYELSAAL